MCSERLSLINAISQAEQMRDETNATHFVVCLGKSYDFMVIPADQFAQPKYGAMLGQALVIDYVVFYHQRR